MYLLIDPGLLSDFASSPQIRHTAEVCQRSEAQNVKILRKKEGKNCEVEKVSESIDGFTTFLFWMRKSDSLSLTSTTFSLLLLLRPLLLFW